MPKLAVIGAILGGIVGIGVVGWSVVNQAGSTPTCNGLCPLESHFGFGPASQIIVPAGGTAMAGCEVPVSGVDYCEMIPIYVTTSSLSTDGLEFELRNSTGVPASFNSITLLSPTEEIGFAIYNESTQTWSSCTTASCYTAVVSTAGLPVSLSTNEILAIQVSPPSGGSSPTGDVLLAIDPLWGVIDSGSMR